SSPASSDDLPKGWEDYPRDRLHDQWQTPIALFRENCQPVWQRTLLGRGSAHGFERDLVVQSPLGEKPTEQLTLIALDDDPRQRWFDFRVKLRPQAEPRNAQYALGVFFGWHPALGADPSSQPRWFLVQLDDWRLPKFPDGRLTICPALVYDGTGGGGLYD